MVASTAPMHPQVAAAAAQTTTSNAKKSDEARAQMSRGVLGMPQFRI